MKISRKVEHLPSSGIREFFELVIGMKDVISLGVGEPDFVTPWNICESSIYSIEKGHTTYTSNKGLKELRAQIARYLKNKHKLSYDPDKEILITTGVSEALDIAMRSLLNPKDKVLIPVPCYVSYYPVTYLAGGKPVFIDTTKTGFKLTPSLVEKHVSSGVKAIILKIIEKFRAGDIDLPVLPKVIHEIQNVYGKPMVALSCHRILRKVHN